MSENVNGVGLRSLAGFVEDIKTGEVSPEVRFCAKSTWLGGTKSEVTIAQFMSGGVDAAPPGRKFTLLVDEPVVMGGDDAAPNPMEYLAAALCGCITAGIATNAAMFGSKVESLEVAVDVDLNVLGLFGLDRTIPSQSSRITYSVKVNGQDAAALQKSREVIDGKSPVRNTLANPVEIVMRTA